jgi:predicted nucleic acid-binding protein
MARYLLDTSVLIDASKSYEPAVSLIGSLLNAGDVLGVCPVIIAEFFTGSQPTELDQHHQFIATLRLWPITVAGATTSRDAAFRSRRRTR